MKELKLFINNKWVDSSDGKVFKTIDPSKNEEIAQLPVATPEDVDNAVKAAKNAFTKGGWPELDADKRADYMLKAADIIKRRAKELARWEAMDVGKTISDAENTDIPYTIRAFEYFANLAREIRGEVISIPGSKVFDYVTYEPYGVVGVIVPWNYPIHIATRSLCPAIATGNTVVLKASSLAPVTCTLLGEIFLEAGFPEGILNVVSGPGGSTGNAIITHPDVSVISFTGSVEVGKMLIKATTENIIKKTILELGGKGPFIAEPDSKVDEAVNSVILGFCVMQGEVCCASTRLYLHEDIYDDFMDKMVAKVNNIKLGDTMDPSTQMGSLISREHLKLVDSYVKEAIKDGAELVCGGEQYSVPPCDKGSYYKPTVLGNVKNSMKCVKEEIFGPVLSVIKYKDLNDAIDMANDSEYSLGATIWSENIKTLYWAAKKLDAGVVWMNTNMKSNMEAPYGGNKNSGFGREKGMIGLMEYLKVKNNILNVSREESNRFSLKY
ncbi:MAG: aldehyde dehydrogenase family protein [Actinobacteria bacterium]|nr:aldehyde dehydrogenase family protein [Actinomycetota bacterium]